MYSIPSFTLYCVVKGLPKAVKVAASGKNITVGNFRSNPKPESVLFEKGTREIITDKSSIPEILRVTGYKL